MCVGVLYLNHKSWKKHVAMLIMPKSHAKTAVRAVRDMLLLLCMTFFVSPAVLFDAWLQELVITDGQKNISCDADIQNIQQGQRLLVSAGRQKDQPMVFKVGCRGTFTACVTAATI
jgi:hypothetical protein